MKSREYTPEEVQEKFLKHIWGLIEYWDSQNESSRAKMEGLAHSIFAAIDGSSAGLPAFILAPLPHSTDKAFCKQQGENYFPHNPRSKKKGNATKVKGDIGGNLAYQLFRVKERMNKSK